MAEGVACDCAIYKRGAAWEVCGWKGGVACKGRSL